MNTLTQTDPAPDEAIVEAMRLLGKKSFALSIHDASFPSTEGQDIGTGSPYTDGGRSFLAFARSLGFDTVILGPQGQKARDNPSPYDATLFSRNILSLDFAKLVDCGGEAYLWRGLLSSQGFERQVFARTKLSSLYGNHLYAFNASHQFLDEVYRGFIQKIGQRDSRALQLLSELDAFVLQNKDWLQADALYHALCDQYDGYHYHDWPAIDQLCPDSNLYQSMPGRAMACRARRAMLIKKYQKAIHRYQLGQLILHHQHADLRETINRWGMRLYGDLQIGDSPCDTWSRGSLFLSHYALGAPPSRTNPKGQPWGYGVLDPNLYLDSQGNPGAAMEFLINRVAKMMNEFDGLRIDHPHGLVCPWVYRSDDPDPFHAVQQGARLFSSPQLLDHPRLACYAIAQMNQLNMSVPRFSDHWVTDLSSAQLTRYALLMEVIVNLVRAHTGSVESVLCEVLSTLPYPLAQVMARYGIGRFRITQKANLNDPSDVYRSENARPEDWIMVGNHDTLPIWRIARSWVADGQVALQAEYLAKRLVPGQESYSFAREIAGDRRKLVHAKMADMFLSPAEHVMVFFPDLLGMEQVYNRPGILDSNNWMLRVPRDYDANYFNAIQHGDALNLPCVLVLAMRARGIDFRTKHNSLICQLQKLAGWWVNNFVET